MDDLELDQRIKGAIAELVAASLEPLPMPQARSGTAATASGESTGTPSDWFGGVSRSAPVRSRRRWLVVATSIVLSAGLAGAYLLAKDEAEQTEAISDGFTEVVSTDGRLYFLPPPGTDLTGGLNYSTEPNVDEGSAIVVGRPTVNGFDSLVQIAHLTTGPTFGEGLGTAVTIAGRPFRKARYAGGSVAEQLADGTWLEYLTASGDEVLADVVEGTAYVDGEISFEQTGAAGLRTLGHVDDISGHGVVHLTYPSPLEGTAAEPPEQWFTLITTISGGDDTALFLAAFGSSVEELDVRGQNGYLIMMNEADGPSVTGVTWQSPTGHAVALFTSMSTDEAIDFAEGMRSVDRETWRAELSPFLDD